MTMCVQFASLPMNPAGAEEARRLVRLAEEAQYGRVLTDEGQARSWLDAFTAVYDAHAAFLPKPTYDGGVWFQSLAKRALRDAWAVLEYNLLHALQQKNGVASEDCGPAEKGPVPNVDPADSAP